MNRTAALITLAQCIARRAVKNRLRACGIKPATLLPRDIDKAAAELLKARRAELFAEARAILSR
jgi:hypothetical protein